MGKDLFLAAQTGDLAKLESLLVSKSKTKTLGPLASLRKGPNVNSQDGSGYTPLHFAALNGKVDAVELLLQVDASANIPDNQGSYPLHLAAFNGHQEVIKTLICRGPSRAKVNEQNIMGDTALHVGAQYGHCAAVRALLEQHADARIRNNRKESPLDLAANYGKLTTVQMLVLSDPGVLSDPLFGHSPLHLAAKNGHTAVIEFLLDCGVNINKMCESGTALHEAALYGKTDVVRLLLNRGADANAKNAKDETVLDVIEAIPSQRSQEITALIYEKSQLLGVNDPNMRSKSLTYSGKQPDFLPPGGPSGTFPQQMKRPGLNEILAASDNKGGPLSDQMQNRSATLGNAPKETIHQYRCLTYPKVERNSGDYSHANISPLPKTDKVDLFDYTMYDSYKGAAAETDENKENRGKVDSDVRHSSPAVLLREDQDLSASEPSGKRSVSVDRAAASYDLVPIRKKKSPDEGAAEAAAPVPPTRSSLTYDLVPPAHAAKQSLTYDLVAPVPASKPSLTYDVVAPVPAARPSLTYDLVAPHLRKLNRESDASQADSDSHASPQSSVDSGGFMHLAASEQRTTSLDSNASDHYKTLVLNESSKFDSIGDRYQKLSYDTQQGQAGESAGKWEEHEGYKLFAPPKKAGSSGEAAGDQSQGNKPINEEKTERNLRFPEATNENVYHVLSPGGAIQGQGKQGGVIADVSNQYSMVPPPRPAKPDGGSVGVYCKLGDSWGQAERKVEQPPLYETPPIRPAPRSPTVPRSPSPTIPRSPSPTIPRSPSPTRMKMQAQSQSVFYEAPPTRTFQKEPNALPVYETPPMRIIRKENSPSRETEQQWVTFDDDGTKDKLKPRALGSSMFYTGTSSEPTEQVMKDDTSISNDKPGESTPPLSKSPLPNLPSVPPPSPAFTNIIASPNVATGQLLSGTALALDRVQPRPVSDIQMDDKLEGATTKPAVQEPDNESAKDRSSSTLERKADPFAYVSRKANTPSTIPETADANSQFRMLHETFNPAEKIQKSIGPTETYDNVLIKNKPLKSENEEKDMNNTVEAGVEAKDVDISKEPQSENVAEKPTEAPVVSSNSTAAVLEEQAPIYSSSIKIKSSGIKQKRTTLERNQNLQATTNLPATTSTETSARDGYRLSSLPEDKTFNESYEWTKIDRFLESLEELVVEEVKPGEKKISTESIETLLESLGVGQYEATFVANGYDDIKFLGGIIAEEQDLYEIGIQNEEHISAILEAIKTLPEPPQIGSDEFPIPATVHGWLQKINLTDYEDKFVRSGYGSMDRVRLVWEFEFSTVLDVYITGHRKRMAHSLGNWQRTPPNQRSQRTWAEKFAEADDGRRSAITPEPSFVDDSMEIANQLLQTAEDLAKDMAKRQTNEAPVQEEKPPAPEQPVKKSFVRTVGDQSVTNMLSQSPPEDIPPLGRSPDRTPSLLTYKPRFNTMWKHRPEVLLYDGVRYRTRYLGSHVVTQVRGTESTVEACQKMMVSSAMLEKIPEIQLVIAVRGIDYVDLQSRNVISTYDIRNISYCAQHPNDLSIFAYITKDPVTKKHYCHVFKAWTLIMADEIILTIGQCFELAYEQHRLLVEAKRNSQAEEKQRTESKAGTKRSPVPTPRKPPPKPVPYAESIKEGNR